VREPKVAQLVPEGNGNRQIAQRLGISANDGREPIAGMPCARPTCAPPPSWFASRSSVI